MLQVKPFSNPALLAAVVLTTGLKLMLLYVAPIAQFFGAQPLDGNDLLLYSGFSLLLFLYLEREKLWRVRRRTANTHA
ncbi:cation transporting ATPase C-terminal domain-containing protein [Synechococcus sp. CS-1328]|uniref:cation transporting ATPase C-terminal domain-containing protein n=1 Tax=Synechococcus sp. CS-1328 TaxID=2847976 RepID=UPI00223BD95E|nr:cation transporting ATPase C-terminal domain-containing protein [Synechococcus sp. CS-1328]MCT0223971.1 cation transporting ATPase C-terminal domain-containing protein [Synechococcus sp. CS-1328]